MAKAVDYLREKGLAAAAKKESRIAAEGVVGTYICNKCGVGAMVEVNCETDFVANTPDFKELVETIAKTIIVSNPPTSTRCSIARSPATIPRPSAR